MQYSGLYRCSGCSVAFSDPSSWREGASAPNSEAPPNVGQGEQARTEPAPTRAVTPTGPQSFSTGWPLLPRLPGEPAGYGHSEEDLKAIREAAARANRSKGRRR
jgi:hypothetical protein